VVYAEGEEEVVLRAVQNVVDESLARPILIGRPEVIESRIERLGLRLKVGEDFESPTSTTTRASTITGSTTTA
jgi:malate dehydrogenase (oxaloacetate-decarboxylating)(NADP+)